MKFWEALKALEEGGMIRCVEWPKGSKIVKSGQGIQFSGSFEFFEHQAPFDEWVRSECIEFDWELYFPENTKFIPFTEVLVGLREGKSYRRKDWDFCCFSSLNKVCFSVHPYRDLSIEDMTADDWVEV